MPNSGILPIRPSMLRLLIGVSLAGAAAGGLNAWLCYAGLPRPVTVHPRFMWHIVPAGVLHGAILAAAACLGALWCRGARWPQRLSKAVAVGWLAGYVSWQPLRISIDATLAWSAWPFNESWEWLLASPLAHFGFVATIYCLAPSSDRMPGARQLGLTLAAGILGSLWYWTAYEQWYLSPLHGAIWGTAVGLSAWSSASAAVRLPGRTADVAARRARPVVAPVRR